LKRAAMFFPLERETPSLSLAGNKDFSFNLQKSLLLALEENQLITSEQTEIALKKLSARQKGANDK